MDNGSGIQVCISSVNSTIFALRFCAFFQSIFPKEIYLQILAIYAKKYAGFCGGMVFHVLKSVSLIHSAVSSRLFNIFMAR